MKFPKIAIFLGLGLLLTACVSNTGEMDSARASAEQMGNKVLKQFQPAAQEAALLNAAPAVNILGQTSGYYTNPDGVAGYFDGYDKPFNFIWKGPVKTLAALDGQTYRIMDGQGRLLVKYMDDDLLLQKYEGGMAAGLWQGQGKLWLRGGGGRGNSIVYEGAFQHGQWEGRGVLTTYDSSGRDMAYPMEYSGTFKYGVLHGHGTWIDLVTGTVVANGIRWSLGEPADLDPERWAEHDKKSELRDSFRQYLNLIIVGPVKMDVQVNDPPGEGSLAVIIPEGAENVKITGAGGRAFQVGRIRHPARKAAATGLLENIPAADYPLSLSITFEREGRLEGVSLTLKRPVIVELS